MSFSKMDFDEYDVIQVKKRADVRDADLRFYYSERGGNKIANALAISRDVADKWGAIGGDRVDLIASKDRQTYGLRLSTTGLLNVRKNSTSSLLRISSVDCCTQIIALQLGAFQKYSDIFEAWIMDDILFFKPIFE